MKRIQIIKAALKLIVESEVHAVTIANIAAEANVGIGTVYKHFESKEDIIQKIWIWQKIQESNYVFKDYKPEGSVYDQFNFLWGKVIRYFIEHQLEFQFSYRFASSPILTKEIHEIAMKDFMIFNDLYEQGIQQNLFKPISAKHLRLYTFSTINGWILWAIDEKVELTDEIISLYLQMAWDAIRK
ncbi:TetR/AcrR family transcriptional regulator [Chryseobacterium oranimense]|uniref:TetR/AcrR family transcriptional regulator n=1 Tax=Chryseobacterium oranimense TaxID=421058 RepID=UPI0031CE3F97